MIGRWTKTIWIAKKIGVEENDYGTEIPIYSKPRLYRMNVQPVSSEAEIEEFGASSKEMQKAFIDYKKYYNQFHEFDLVYLDGASPNGEEVYGENANYRMYPPRNQYRGITIYMKRLENT